MQKNLAEKYFCLMNAKRQNLMIDLGALTLRVMAGLMMAVGHGYGKLTDFEEMKGQFINFLGLGPTVSTALAVFGEFFCGIAVALGLATRATVIPMITTMLVATFMVHLADPVFATGPGERSKEMALLYLCSFLGILFLGSGRFSLDYLVAKLTGKNNSL